jgi:hypothetical protein
MTTFEECDECIGVESIWLPPQFHDIFYASQVKGHNVDYNTYEELHFSWDYFGKRPF